MTLLLLEKGRQSYDRRAWKDAYDALLCADRASPLDVDDLDRLATATYLIGRDLEFLNTLERLYRAHVEAADCARAARRAYWLAIIFMIRGEAGRSNAWTARCQRLVADLDCVERGYLAAALAEHELRKGDTAAAHAIGAQAGAIGESFHDADLIAAARHVQGRALIEQGDVAAGLARLDELMLAVVANELQPIMTGLMYCSVIDTCRQIYALGRACEWTAALSRACDEQPQMVAFSGPCLVHRAEIMQLQGAWPDALSEACRACERAERADRKPPGAAFYQQAEIHRLRGECSKAEDAYRAASERGFEPQPGLALLRLAQGRTAAACAAIRRLTNATRDRLRRARLLPAHFEIMLAIGDVDDARRARDEVEELARGFDADGLRAVVAQADGALALAEGRAQASLDPLRRAFDLWQALEAPYEAARVRVLIGDACRALGDDEAAELEHQAARSVFERLGARPDVACLDALKGAGRGDRADPARTETTLTPRELHVLRLISSGRTNKEIAEELRRSERTIDRHVTNILTKLDVRSRTAATAYAFSHKLF